MKFFYKTPRLFKKVEFENLSSTPSVPEEIF